MEKLEIIFYALIQGTTEFLPISSSAHLLILEELFKWEKLGITYAISAHIGTLIAVCLHQKKEIKMFFKSLKNLNRLTLYSSKNNLAINLIICTTPIIIIGGFFMLFLHNFYLGIFVLAWASIVGGVFLELADRFSKNEENKIITKRAALLAGFFQCLSIIPGMSRSGSVITSLRLMGIGRVSSAKFSLLASIPVIISAGIVEFFSIMLINKSFEVFINFFLIASLSSITAFFTIKLLINWLKKRSFTPFVIYRIILGMVILSLF